MRIAFTGVSGFIGSTSVHQLASAGHAVTGLLRASSLSSHVEDALDRTVIGSMEDTECFEELLDGADVLVHNAVDWMPLKQNDLQGHLGGNLASTLLLLDRAADADVRVVYISSVAVHHHMLDRWEGDIDDEHPMRPGTLYGAMKASIELHLWALHASRGLSFVSLRPSAVYGIDPVMKRSIGYPILEHIKDGRAYERSGGGKFVHVDDVASAILRSLDNPTDKPGIYHLADCYARWSDWTAIACNILGSEAPPEGTSPDRPRNMFNNTLLENELGLHLDRGMDGIRVHLEELNLAMSSG
jgi:nucleoside-diphosphate-sugar epimerase